MGEYYNNYLKHYGVKGMKWGVRKADKYLSKSKTYRMYADDYDPSNYTVKLSAKERSKLQAKSDKFRKKADDMESKARQEVSAEYKKHIDKAQSEINRSYNERYVKAYNKAADDMNNGMIDKYNSEYKKKLGDKAKNHDYGNDEEYLKGYEDMFGSHLTKHFNKDLADEIKNNKNYQRAKEICDAYGMTSFDKFAKDNEDTIYRMANFMDIE